MNWFVLALVVLLVLENVQTGWVVEDEDENEEEDESPGSWRACFRLRAWIGSMDRGIGAPAPGPARLQNNPYGLCRAGGRRSG